jgi:predicted GNAT family acetyltransferase
MLQFFTYNRIHHTDMVLQKMHTLLWNTYHTDQEVTPECRYYSSQNSDYWFALYTPDTDIIIAECSVQSTTPKHFYICDVWVHGNYRGNCYCVQLLLNVFYMLECDNSCVFSLECFRNNHAAKSCYTKVFGDPVTEDEVFYYFST